MDNFETAIFSKRDYAKHLATAFLCLFFTITISFFSYDYLFYFVIAVNIVYVLLLVLYRDPIYILYLFVFSAFFDIGDVFTFGGSFNLRIWYVVSFWVLTSTILSSLLSKRLFLIKRSRAGLLLFFTSITCLSGISILTNPKKTDALLYLSKIYLFYVPIVIAFVRWANKERIYRTASYFLFMAFWISLFGIFQFSTGLLQVKLIKYARFVPDDLFRPHGFFSETTWMGIMSAMAVIIGCYLYDLRQMKRYLFMSLPMLIVLILSVTRGAYIALGSAMFFLAFFRRKTCLTALLLLLVVGFFCVFLLNHLSISSDFSLVDWTLYKFRLADDAAKGRIEAFRSNIAMLDGNILSGLGFGYSEKTELSKSTVGSKAFNVFLGVFSCLGLIGFLIFVLSSGMFTLNYIKRILKSQGNYEKCFLAYGLAFFIVFLVYSQNAPLYLHPLGWVMFSISLSIYVNRKSLSG